MNYYIPENEQDGIEFERLRKQKEDKQRHDENVKRLNADPVELLTANGFKKEIAGINFDKAVKAFNLIKEMPRKGLIVSGAVGTGKTFAVKSLFPFAKSFKLVDVCQLRLLMPRKDEEGVAYWELPDGDVILDDLGNEAVKSDYGIKVDVVGDFLMQWHTARYENKNETSRLYATTNLTIKQLQERYGDRIFDRLVSMCVIVLFEGTSKREKPIII